MASTGDSIEKLAAEAEQAKKAKEREAEARRAEEPVKGTFYSPGERLEGHDEFFVIPEDWENEGHAFDIKRGKHEAIIEGVWSSELDGGDIDKPITYGKSKKKTLIATALAVSIVAVGGFAFLSQKDPGVTGTPTSQAPPADPLNNFAVAFTNPIAKALPQAPAAPTNSIAVSSSGRALSTSQGDEIGFSGTQITSPDSPCSVELPTDFCLAGMLSSGDGQLPVYFAKNAVTLPALSEAAEYKQFEKAGAALAAQEVVMFAGKPTRFLVFVLPNSTGWMVATPPGATGEQIELVKNSITLEKTR